MKNTISNKKKIDFNGKWETKITHQPKKLKTSLLVTKITYIYYHEKQRDYKRWSWEIRNDVDASNRTLKDQTKRKETGRRSVERIILGL